MLEKYLANDGKFYLGLHATDGKVAPNLESAHAVSDYYVCNAGQIQMCHKFASKILLHLPHMAFALLYSK